MSSLFLLLVACSWTSRSSGGSAGQGSAAAFSSAAPVSASSGSNAVSVASCNGGSCSVTLGGRGSAVRVLGTVISLTEVRAGRATVQVGVRTVSCSQGGTLSAGRLTLRCTAVTDETVSFVGTAG